MRARRLRRRLLQEHLIVEPGRRAPASTRSTTGRMKSTAKVFATLLVSFVSLVGPACEGSEPAFADADRAPTVDDVVHVMRVLPPEACLYTGKACKPGRYDQGRAARVPRCDCVARGRNADGRPRARRGPRRDVFELRSLGQRRARCRRPRQVARNATNQVPATGKAQNPDCAVPNWIASRATARARTCRSTRSSPASPAAA